MSEEPPITTELRKVEKYPPPISIFAILSFAWGMTMSLSSQNSQNDLAYSFRDRFNDLWKKYQDSPDAISFLNEVSFRLSAVQRSYGFEREVYMHYIKEWDNLRINKLKYYENLADVTSASNDGLYGRILAFLGAGSIGNFLGLQSINISSPTASIQLIGLFLLAGSIGFGVLSMILKYYASKKIESFDRDISNKKSDLWKKTVKPQIVDLLCNFAKDLKQTLTNYKMKDESIPDSDEQLKVLISNKILPSDDCYQLRV